MEWRLDDNRPIWLQLQEQLTRKILSGGYHVGEKLPSVRDLAAEAGVNPNTMQRALTALDAAGLTATNRTMGRTVTEDTMILEGMRATLAQDIIRQFYDSAAELGYTMQRALAGLDMEGLTVTNRTTGRTVTEDNAVLEGMRATLAADIIRHFYESAAELGYTKEQALELLKRRDG